MKEFFDTSVLVAAFWKGHPDHVRSLRAVSAANRKKSACAAHTLAEVYSTMTRLPVKDVIPPDQALLFVQEVRQRFAIVTLSEEDYLDEIDRSSRLGIIGGRIYDALLLRCAAKVKSHIIYTWNLKDFRAIRPEFADLMRAP